MKTIDRNEGVGKPPTPFRTVQIHPTRRCNLACKHCYSSSSPALNTMLDIAALKTFLGYAYKKGFNNIAVSGGEPFLYDKLEELLMYTHSLGYQNTIASNGMLLQSERNQRILEHVDLIAISIDGLPDLHDHIRGQKGAYNKMMKGVETLNKLQKPFGFIHTVTPQSWESLIQLGQIAYENGACLFQLHPLEMYGRAVEELSASSVNDTLAHRIFILADYLRSKYDKKMSIQLDLLHKDYLREFPEVVNVFEAETESCLSLDTIIVDEMGEIYPAPYGLDTWFRIGNVHSFSEFMFEQFAIEKMPVIKTMYNELINKILGNEKMDILNWSELLVDESRYTAEAMTGIRS